MDNLPENAIFIIVFLAIGAVRWFLEAAGKKKQPPAQEPWEEYDYQEHADRASPRSSLEELYDEARREILDRQNRQIPEPEVLRRQLGSETPAPPPLPPVAESAKATPPVVKAPQREAEAPYQLKKVRRPVLSPAEQQALANLEKMGHQPKPLSASNNRIRKLLSDPTSARDAVILSEILGKPKSLL